MMGMAKSGMPGLAGLAGGPPGLGMSPGGIPGLGGVPRGMAALPGGLPGLPQLPGLPPIPSMMAGMPGMPGMPPAAGMGGKGGQAAMEAWVYRQAAEAYDMAKNAGVRPEVQELADHHGLDERATRALDEEMKKRLDTFDSDMQALWVGLEGAKNPSGLLMIKLKDMRAGTFRGMTALGKTVQEFAKRHRLDAQAAVKLAEVLDKRNDPEDDMSKIGKHLERSNKPSSLMMMLLRDLREGKPVKEPEYSAAIGSRVHEKELKTKDRSRSRREPSRERGRDRERGRSRDRRRD